MQLLLCSFLVLVLMLPDNNYSCLGYQVSPPPSGSTTSRRTYFQRLVTTATTAVAVTLLPNVDPAHAVISSKYCASGQGEGCDDLSEGNEFIRKLQEKSAVNAEMYAQVRRQSLGEMTQRVFCLLRLWMKIPSRLPPCGSPRNLLAHPMTAPLFFFYIQQNRQAYYMKNYPDFFAAGYDKTLIKKRDGTFMLVDGSELQKLKDDNKLDLEIPKAMGGKVTDLTQKPILVLKE